MWSRHQVKYRRSDMRKVLIVFRYYWRDLDSDIDQPLAVVVIPTQLLAETDWQRLQTAGGLAVTLNTGAASLDIDIDIIISNINVSSYQDSYRWKLDSQYNNSGNFTARENQSQK